MVKKKVNWNTIDNQMKNLKYPLAFIFKILKYQNKIEDYQLSLVTRYFLKHNINISLEYPLYSIFNILNNNFPVTKKIINDYYSSILKKYFFILYIINFKKSFKKSILWNKKLIIQKQNIKNLINVFKSYFDCSITNIDGFNKFISQLKLDSNMINYKIKSSMKNTIKLFGLYFFKHHNIKLIKEIDYEELKIIDKIKYVYYYYHSILQKLELTNDIYDLLIIYDNKIKQIITPKPININTTFSNNTIYTNSDSEDFYSLINYNNDS